VLQKASKTISDNRIPPQQIQLPSRPLSGFMPCRQFGFCFTGQSQSSTEEIKETSGSGLATVVRNRTRCFELQHPWGTATIIKIHLAPVGCGLCQLIFKVTLHALATNQPPKTTLYLFQVIVVGVCEVDM
jgi:hypothetical protein